MEHLFKVAESAPQEPDGCYNTYYCRQHDVEQPKLNPRLVRERLNKFTIECPDDENHLEEQAPDQSKYVYDPVGCSEFFAHPKCLESTGHLYGCLGMLALDSVFTAMQHTVKIIRLFVG